MRQRGRQRVQQRRWQRVQQRGCQRVIQGMWRKLDELTWTPPRCRPRISMVSATPTHSLASLTQSPKAPARPQEPLPNMVRCMPKSPTRPQEPLPRMVCGMLQACRKRRSAIPGQPASLPAITSGARPQRNPASCQGNPTEAGTPLLTNEESVRPERHAGVTASLVTVAQPVCDVAGAAIEPRKGPQTEGAEEAQSWAGKSGEKLPPGECVPLSEAEKGPPTEARTGNPVPGPLQQRGRRAVRVL